MNEAALQAGIDRIEIHELLNRYAHAIDFGDFGLLDHVFTEDAVADFSSVGEYVDVESVLHGRNAIVAYYEVALAPFQGVLHFMTNHLVELDGDSARSRSYMHVLNMSMGGIYSCRCRRTDAGWRIEHLKLDERNFDEAANKLRSHMQAVDGAAPS
jgi:hypothetical protein